MALYSLNLGEFRVVTEPGSIISTVLGSCVAVCLHDAAAQVGGMNHFMLPKPQGAGASAQAEMQCYGVHAMELLINEMMHRGAMRPRLRAHLYGGANLFSGLDAIGQANAAFARDFMRTEGISVVHADLGGRAARKLEFRPYDGKVRATLALNNAVPAAAAARGPDPHGDLELF